jgi:hypothetical protein
MLYFFFNNLIVRGNLLGFFDWLGKDPFGTFYLVLHSFAGLFLFRENPCRGSE